MASPLRMEFAGALYHITTRGNRNDIIYEDDEDRQQFLKLLNDVCNTYNWACHAYSLMSNHNHLLIETPDANLGPFSEGEGRPSSRQALKNQVYLLCAHRGITQQIFIQHAAHFV